MTGAAALPPAAPAHVIGERICLRCGAPADGLLRVAIWVEEEKGRLGARPTVLCAVCHEGFFSGAFGRVEAAQWFHAAKEYEPREWIGRIDRDRLLERVCLHCGVILDPPAEGDEVRCPQCRRRVLFRMRGDARISASIAGG